MWSVQSKKKKFSIFEEGGGVCGEGGFAGRGSLRGGRKEGKCFQEFHCETSQHLRCSLHLLFDSQDMNHSEEPRETSVESE